MEKQNKQYENKKFTFNPSKTFGGINLISSAARSLIPMEPFMRSKTCAFAVEASLMLKVNNCVSTKMMLARKNRFVQPRNSNITLT